MSGTKQPAANDKNNNIFVHKINFQISVVKVFYIREERISIEWFLIVFNNFLKTSGFDILKFIDHH